MILFLGKEAVMANYGEQLNLICFRLNKKYRSEIEIIALILEAARHASTGRYFLMKQTGINFTQLKKYLETLIRLGFIEADIKERKMFYRASQEGLAFLNQYSILRDMLTGAYSKTRQANLVYERASLPRTR
jgi:predicted transcriptional regulator